MRKYSVFLSFCLVASWPVAAQEQSAIVAGGGRETDITVVANAARESLLATGQAVSIVGSDEIAQVQGADIVRVVERLPGVTVGRNGALGGFTAVRVRGAEAEQLLVLIDGVRVADTAAPGGGFDFGSLLPAGIAKIELLRGSNSTIWGSQAMGGVLAIETGIDSGVRGAAEYGAADNFHAQATAGGSAGALAWSVDGAVVDGDGISSAAAGTERDGLRQWQVGGRAEAEVSDGLRVHGAARHVDARLDLDGFPAPDFVFVDTPEYQRTRRTDGSAGADWRGNDLELHASWSRSETERASFDPALGAEPNYTARGRDERAALRGKWDFADDFRLHFGGERGWSRMATLFDAAQHAASSGAYAQLGYWRDGLALNAGLRIEDHDRFGSAWTFGADGALDLGGGWRGRASYGEGFKAPTLFQLLSDYGNPALRPERSRGFDVGLAKGDRNAPLHLAASLFRRDSRDLIDFVSCFGTGEGICADRPFGTYDNVGRARAQGGEIEAAVTLAGAWRLQGVYSYVESRNRTEGAANEGNDLARRPRHAATLSAEWASPWTVRLASDLRIVSRSFDDAANGVRLGGYALLTVRAALPLTDAIELYGRVENVTGAAYQVAAGYGTPGRAAYIGARAQF